MADPIRHIVKPGETLFGIADKNGVSPEAIKAANPQIPDPNKIFPGQVVFIPAASPTGSTGASEGQPTTTVPTASGPIQTGLDGITPFTDNATCMRNEGHSFAVRYYTRDERKRTLTVIEARTLVKAGLQLGAIFEDKFPTNPADQPRFFTHERGLGDGRAAHDRAENKIGQPSNTPIYFAVDFDASKQNLATGIKRYFEGVREALLAANNGTLKYQIGVYGSGLSCTEMLRQGLATFAWLAKSPGFRGTKDFREKKLYNLRQRATAEGLIVCHTNVDIDETNPDPVKFPPGLFTIPV